MSGAWPDKCRRWLSFKALCSPRFSSLPPTLSVGYVMDPSPAPEGAEHAQTTATTRGLSPPCSTAWCLSGCGATTMDAGLPQELGGLDEWRRGWQGYDYRRDHARMKLVRECRTNVDGGHRTFVGTRPSSFQALCSSTQSSERTGSAVGHGSGMVQMWFSSAGSAVGRATPIALGAQICGPHDPTA